jgi:methylated-DNA-protein-cysteine methyltransferase-like protein
MGFATAAPDIWPMIDCRTSGLILKQHMSETDIDQRVWQVVALIPPGKVATYGDVARLAGLPGAARRVGRALRGLPEDTRIPWHRVLNASGRISLPADSKSHRRQRQRLEAEGIQFRNGRLSLGSYRWEPW